MKNKEGNMYKEATIWNVGVGCNYNCKYCTPSFKAQMKRQKPVIDKNGRKRGCQQCYDYIPHFHEERLKKVPSLKKGSDFTWIWSSGDISFASRLDMLEILLRVEELPTRIFFFQSKNPRYFKQFNFPDNTILGTTIESNRWYNDVSNAPNPYIRWIDFYTLQHPRKFVTIEPVLNFDLLKLVNWMGVIAPERVYIGYDTKKTWWLVNGEKFYLSNYEPPRDKVEALINNLEEFTTVKRKYMKND